MRSRFLTTALTLALAAAVRADADEPKLPAELQRLAGVWVFDRFDIGGAGGDNNLLRVWTSTVTITGADGKPAAGVIVSEYMYRRSARSDHKEKPEWQHENAKKTDANGKLVFEYDEPPSVVRDAQRKQMAFVSRSPAAWLQGEVAV